MTIRAARLLGHGAPPVVETIPAPDAEAGETLVDMDVAALNPVDLAVVDGRVAGDGSLPRVVGIEGVGRHRGRSVLVCGHGVGLSRDGTIATRVAVPSQAVFRVPHGVSPEQAAACGVAGATAVRLVALADVVRGETVLVLGAAGAVGGAVCQLLSGSNVHVLGQTRSADRADLVERAGARAVVVGEPNELEAVFAKSAPAVVIDGLGDDWTSATIRFAPPHARIVLYGASAGATSRIDVVSLYRKSVNVRGYSGMTEEAGLLSAAVDAALDACASGRLRFPVHARLPLDEVRAAYRALASNPRGKIIIDIR